MTGEAAILLCGLFLAHYLGDFTPLATRRMLEAKAAAKPLWPIAAHAGVHTGLMALVIALVSRPEGFILLAASAIQFMTHFLLDAGRAGLGRRHPILNDAKRSPFWHVLGLDQLAHAVVLIVVAAIVLA
ncbi:MAG: DUF3307 domain-containing protein [Gemmatimonadales bacterium]|jgi:hypothetical protein